MADLKFVDQHNMVACLERTKENAEFHRIVDFLTTSSIHYALTVSPTIYASHIEQFWNTANSQTLNDVKQIHATFDGKTVVISESSVRSDLHFNDEDGITCLTNTTIFENLALIGQALQKDTQLPQTSVPIPNVVDEAIFKERDDRVVRAATTAASLDAAQASGNITKTQSTAMSNDPLSQEIGSGVNTSRSDEEKNEQQDLTDFVPPTSHDSPLSGGHTRGSDEGRPNINELMAICSNLSNMVLALEQSKTAQDLVINKLQKKVKRLEKELRARTPGMKLFKIGTSSRKGLDKENVSKQRRKSDKTKPMFKDSNFDVLDDAMENVKGGSTTEQITTAVDTLNTTSFNVSTARPSNGSAASPFTITTRDIFEDEMTTIADTLMAIRSARPRTTSVVICNVKEEPRRATPVPTVQSQDKGKCKMVEPEPTLKNPRKSQIQMDEELAQRLFEEEQAQFEREQRIAKERAAEQEAKDAALIEQIEDARFLVETIAARKKFFAAQRAAEIRNRPPTRTQLRNQMITYLKHIGKYTDNQLKSKCFEEIQKLYKKEQQGINDFVPMSDDSGKKDDSSSKQEESSKNRPRAEHDEESVKKQKLQDDAKKEELRACLDIV
ncbi:hypothetical protein Tco_1091146 [Tanacetum coccineum]|uniref:Uncharacterized protein n=1 Tax=Tanacetum coccineum TaxID=301880 RepID=A0ABQ5I671_9ASTR